MSYLEGTGQHQELYKEMLKRQFVKKGYVSRSDQVFDSAVIIMMDYYHNGFGTDWAAPAQYILDHMNVPYPVYRMFQECGKGHKGGDPETVELMMDFVLEYIQTHRDEQSHRYIWDTEPKTEFFH